MRSHCRKEHPAWLNSLPARKPSLLCEQKQVEIAPSVSTSPVPDEYLHEGEGGALFVKFKVSNRTLVPLMRSEGVARLASSTETAPMNTPGELQAGSPLPLPLLEHRQEQAGGGGDFEGAAPHVHLAQVAVDVFSGDELMALMSDPSASVPPSPPATPAPLLFAAHQGMIAPIQVTLAVVVVCVAFLAELYTVPVILFAAAGVAVMSVAYMAQASPRIVARAVMLLVVCAPTLRVVDVLVRSPAALIDELDKLEDARLGMVALFVAGGATFGAFSPCTLSCKCKLRAAAYSVCAATCGDSIFRVRMGDERMPAFAILNGALPFFAAVLIAHVASRQLYQTRLPAL